MLRFAAMALVVRAALGSAEARAEPGQAIRLGGIEPQGPATRAVTALHHNPAMLAAMRGTRAHVSFGAGVDYIRVRRNEISETGAPTSRLGSTANVGNPTLGYFAGGSLYLDPLAFGLGIYDLGSRYRLNSANSLRFHLAPDPDPSCILAGNNRCPPNGGAVDYRHDLTVALAWNLGPVQLGAGVHFPLVQTRFAEDSDTELAPPPGAPRCQNPEDPTCAERVGFKGWTRWIAGRDSEPGFDAALTFGVSTQFLGERISLGARYRTFPLRRGGDMVLSGVALVCRPNPVAAGDTELLRDVEPCDVAQPTRATLRQKLPQEFALGGSFVLGRSKLWQVDTNLYWMDLCPGGATPASCSDDGAQRLRLVGLDRQAFVLPEFNRYRGRQDLYGIDLFSSYRAQSYVTVVFAGHMNSPAVRKGATTAGNQDRWRLGASVGARFRIRQGNFELTPGYGIDTYLPTRVSASEADFDPTARTAFEAAGADINAPGADAVLEGRGRPTNAGRYFSMLHTVWLALTWGERIQGR